MDEQAHAMENSGMPAKRKTGHMRKHKKLEEWKPGVCAHWMGNKRRYCSFPAKPGCNYCGNHMLAMDAEKCAASCPACTTYVAAQDLAAHLKKCPKVFLLRGQQAEPHFCPDINAGSEEEPDLLAAPSSYPGAGREQESCTSMTAEGRSSRIPHAAVSTDTSADGAVSSSSRSPFAKGKANARASAASQLGPRGLEQLLARLEHVYQQECGASEPPLHVLRPPQCEPLLQPQENRQFSIKHALQQASLVGHIVDMGLVSEQELLPVQDQQHAERQGESWQQQQQQQQQFGSGVCLVELGAGKGGLAAMVAAALQPVVSSAVVMDSQANFKFKSDRFIRGACRDFSRFSLDLKDFAVWRMRALQQVQPQQTTPQQRQQGGDGATCQNVDGTPRNIYSTAPEWMVAGKHQRGAATMGKSGDGTSTAKACRAPDWADPAEAPAAAPTMSQSGNCAVNQDGGSGTMSQGDDGTSAGAGASTAPDWMVVGKHLCGAATDYALRGCLPPLPADGHATPEADVMRRLRGLAIATCCHHRCSWRSYVGKQAFRAWGFSPLEFELVCWMTGWALCGHDAAPGQAREGGDSDDEDGEDTDDVAAREASSSGGRCAADGEVRRAVGDKSQGSSVPMDHVGKAAAASGDNRPLGGQVSATTPCNEPGESEGNERTALCSGSTRPEALPKQQQQQQHQGEVEAHSQLRQQQQQQQVLHGGHRQSPQRSREGEVEDGDEDSEWDPVRSLPRDKRMAIGAMCKQLIDRGRLLWVCQRMGLPSPLSKEPHPHQQPVQSHSSCAGPSDCTVHASCSPSAGAHGGQPAPHTQSWQSSASCCTTGGCSSIGACGPGQCGTGSFAEFFVKTGSQCVAGSTRACGTRQNVTGSELVTCAGECVTGSSAGTCGNGQCGINSSKHTLGLQARRQAPLAAKIVRYIEAEVSGENRALLARMR